MTDLRKAAEMALGALENNQPVNYCQNNNGERFPMFKEDPFRFDCNTKAIEALRQALAQPEQEPVAWEKNYDIACSLLRQAHDILATTQYPIKRPWVSLTDEEIDYIWGVTPPDYENFFEFPRAIEAALKEKNNG